MLGVPRVSSPKDASSSFSRAPSFAPSAAASFSRTGSFAPSAARRTPTHGPMLCAVKIIKVRPDLKPISVQSPSNLLLVPLLSALGPRRRRVRTLQRDRTAPAVQARQPAAARWLCDRPARAQPHLPADGAQMMMMSMMMRTTMMMLLIMMMLMMIMMMMMMMMMMMIMMIMMIMPVLLMMMMASFYPADGAQPRGASQRDALRFARRLARCWRPNECSLICPSSARRAPGFC